MMEVEELQLVELIGWFAFGMLKVGGCCTRYVDADFEFLPWRFIVACSCLDIKGRSHLSISTRRNLLVSTFSCEARLLLILYFAVLTGSKDGTMLLGELEPGVTI